MQFRQGLRTRLPGDPAIAYETREIYEAAFLEHFGRNRRVKEHLTGRSSFTHSLHLTPELMVYLRRYPDNTVLFATVDNGGFQHFDGWLPAPEAVDLYKFYERITSDNGVVFFPATDLRSFETYAAHYEEEACQHSK